MVEQSAPQVSQLHEVVRVASLEAFAASEEASVELTRREDLGVVW